MLGCRTYFCLLLDGLIDNVMIWYNLLLGCECQILHSLVELFEVDVTQSAVEQDLTRKQLELQAQLFVVDVVVPAKVEKCVVEVCQCLFKVSHQEV